MVEARGNRERVCPLLVLKRENSSNLNRQGGR
jgi:hypothetical protein